MKSWLTAASVAGGFALLIAGGVVLLVFAPIVLALVLARELWKADLLPTWRRLRRAWARS